MEYVLNIPESWEFIHVTYDNWVNFTAGQYGNESSLVEVKEDADGLQHSFEDVSL